MFMSPLQIVTCPYRQLDWRHDLIRQPISIKRVCRYLEWRQIVNRHFKWRHVPIAKRIGDRIFSPNQVATRPEFLQKKLK